MVTEGSNRFMQGQWAFFFTSGVGVESVLGALRSGQILALGGLKWLGSVDSVQRTSWSMEMTGYDTFEDEPWD